MKVKILKSVVIETPRGPRELHPGQILDFQGDISSLLKTKKAAEANERGETFCYWIDGLVPDCQLPCYAFTGTEKISECKHFSEYWAIRLKELDEEKRI